MRLALLTLGILLLCSCAVRGPIQVPEFSEFSFTGNAYSGDMPIPIQGALTKRGNELKFALAARQGIVLGYGTIDASTGKIDLAFSQSSGTKRLLKGVGEALMELLPVVQKHEGSSENWTIGDNGVMRYHSPRLELDGRLKGAKL